MGHGFHNEQNSTSHFAGPPAAERLPAGHRSLSMGGHTSGVYIYIYYLYIYLFMCVYT